MLENVMWMKAVRVWIAYVKMTHSCEMEQGAPSLLDAASL
jgi:hypothetical protein